eukprot:m.523944 g.523944  ORF g.523944 m.523944 type:complete len:67 (-) comp21983_c0_seq3:285-485(-)
MISDTEQQLRMVEIRKGMLLDKLSTLPAATTQPAGQDTTQIDECGERDTVAVELEREQSWATSTRL